MKPKPENTIKKKMITVSRAVFIFYASAVVQTRVAFSRATASSRSRLLDLFSLRKRPSTTGQGRGNSFCIKIILRRDSKGRLGWDMRPKVGGQRGSRSGGRAGVSARKESNETQQGFIESQNHCALCNGVLDIQVESYLEDFYLREEAKCPNCEVKTRVKNHRIH